MDKSVNHLANLVASNALSEKAPTHNGQAANPAADRQKLAQEFTSFLYLEVLKAMRATLPQGGFIESESLSRDIYTSMLDAEIARAIAKRDTSEFAKNVARYLEKMPASKLPSEPQLPAPAGSVSSIFGPRADPLSGAKSFHHGVDIAAPAGTAINAALGGKVKFSGWLDGYGNVVDVDHGNGLISRYGHNAQNLVREGEQVQAGQVIALVGSTGRSTGAHVHFEVRKLGKPVNPETLLGNLAKGTKIRAIA